jgi:hypothetical protein
MKKLFTDSEFKKSKAKDLLPCECYTCKKTFYLKKHHIQGCLNPGQKKQGKYCSRKCQRTEQLVSCNYCKKEFYKHPNQIKKSPNHFCSKSCAVTYHNTHKTYGTRRSKLEIYLEEQLTLMYPDLHIDYNKTEAINSELDIYIPSLNLAFELNGIFHYEPIYGQKKLNQTQNNDQRKFQACIEKNISLCIIDVSGLNYFKPDKANKFLNIITDIINKKVTRIGFEPILQD